MAYVRIPATSAGGAMGHVSIPATSVGGAMGRVGIPAADGFVDPNSITGCVVWLDASQHAGSDLDHVATFVNRATGAANNATQGTDALRPILKTGANGINGKNVIRANGTTQYMAGLSFDPGTTGLTFFFAFRTGASVAATKVMFGSGGAGGTTGIRWVFAADNQATQGMGWAGAAAGTNLGAFTGIAANTAYITSYRKTAAGPWSITGGSAGSPADASFPGNPFNVTLWNEAAANPYFSSVDIAEIIVYDTDLSDGNRTTVLAYLAAKWAI